MRRRVRAQRELVKDIVFICIGALVAVVLVQVGTVDRVIDLLGGGVGASFVSGVFFTSAFTLAPASVALAHIADSFPVFEIVFWGACGALCGDLILFFFIRDRFSRDLLDAVRPSLMKHILASFHLGFMKWLAPIVGALIIASPLPDEFGLMLMGLSRVRLIVLIPVSFLMNAIGIYTIVWFAQVV